MNLKPKTNLPMKTLLLLTLLNCVAVVAYTQNILTSTTKWNSDQTLNVSTGALAADVTSLTISSSTSMVWKNQDGSIRKNFQIIESIGEWTNISNDGKIQYEVTDGQMSGTISIRRVGGTSKILILMVTQNQPPEGKELQIENTETL